ncbi:hypothetical protein [Prauserella cavernicola]|uniref:Uncharacterized protein n=1 Tax=Prauserella cavernicola TaxID=2800127 RepID=A0A934V3J4_9PSEU|nr:hypothetical protein [Prauserella cavernicola]MBK1783759.1 hypothetical protein [Prauserella cavernicola]
MDRNVNHTEDLHDGSISELPAYEPPSFEDMGSFRGETGGGGALYYDPNIRGIV